MKLRLMGPPDIVRKWADRLALHGITGREYPNRGSTDVRWYCDIDDRTAAMMGDLDGIFPMLQDGKEGDDS